MSPETEPTPWELMRLLRSIDDRLKSMDDRLVPLAVFRAEQDSTRERLAEVNKDVSDLKAETHSSHANLRATVDTYRTSQEALEREQRAARGRVWLAVGVAILSGLVSLGVGVVLQGMGVP